MKQEYQNWIIKNYPKDVPISLQCTEVIKSMIKAFPKLIVCRGFILTKEPLDLSPECISHWWLKDETGEIIDPIVFHYQTEIMAYQIVEYKIVGLSRKIG
jgi:hypothetical protein